jgi:hypothetical protein
MMSPAGKSAKHVFAPETRRSIFCDGWPGQARP